MLALLVATGFCAAFGLAFVSHAPNRLVSGVGVSLGRALSSAPGVLAAVLLLTTAVLAAAVFTRPTAPSHAHVALASAVHFALLAGLTGMHAATLAAGSTPLARTSLGAGFWLLALLCALALADALAALRLPNWAQAMAWAAAAAPLAAMLAFGALDDLSLVKEYLNRRDVFGAAVLRHLQIVVASLAATLAVGVPLGAALHRHERVARPVFAVLNVLQTVPSIALFGLLMVPLAALAAALPGLARLGLSGVGLAPAVVALTLYS